MGKADTVARYIDDYLKGKSDEVQERFRSKDINKQYCSIMQWRSKLRRSQQPPTPGAELLADLRSVKAKMPKAAHLSAQECKLLYAEIDALRQTLAIYEEEQKQRRIHELEAQREAIAAELQRLRGNEPGLFDLIPD